MKLETIKKQAAFFAFVFLFVFIITNIPAFNDAQGRNFGLFKIDPIDNIVHLLTAVLGIIAAWRSSRLSAWFLLIFGILYNLDAVVGLTQQRGLLDLSIFRYGLGSPDFSIINILLNIPHIGIAIPMIIYGYTEIHGTKKRT